MYSGLLRTVDSYYSYRRFEGTIQGQAFNASTYLPVDTRQYPRRPESSATELWETQNSQRELAFTFNLLGTMLKFPILAVFVNIWLTKTTYHTKYLYMSIYLSIVIIIIIIIIIIIVIKLCTGRTAYRGSRVLALPIHNHGIRREWGVSVTPRPLFTLGKDPVPIVQETGRAPGPVCTGVENLAPTGIGSPDRPACSQSLYRLRYPAQSVSYCMHVIPKICWLLASN
jgi:hypothetical protein